MKIFGSARDFTVIKIQKISNFKIKLHNRKNPPQGLEADEKKQALDLHNKLRAKIARGDEIRGRPGPQPNAANMMQMVIFISFGAIYFWGCP